MVPRAPLPTTAAYLPPALRTTACAATLVGCPYTRSSTSQACMAGLQMAEPLCAAPYTMPQRRTAEEQAAVEAAGRPGRPAPSRCWPQAHSCSPRLLLLLLPSPPSCKPAKGE